MPRTVIVPIYRAPTFVGSALSRNPAGELVHRTVVDCTKPGQFHIRYSLRRATAK